LHAQTGISALSLGVSIFIVIFTTIAASGIIGRSVVALGDVIIVEFIGQHHLIFILDISSCDNGHNKHDRFGETTDVCEDILDFHVGTNSDHIVVTSSEIPLQDGELASIVCELFSISTGVDIVEGFIGSSSRGIIRIMGDNGGLIKEDISNLGIVEDHVPIERIKEGLVCRVVLDRVKKGVGKIQVPFDCRLIEIFDNVLDRIAFEFPRAIGVSFIAKVNIELNKLEISGKICASDDKFKVSDTIRMFLDDEIRAGSIGEGVINEFGAIGLRKIVGDIGACREGAEIRFIARSKGNIRVILGSVSCGGVSIILGEGSCELEQRSLLHRNKLSINSGRNSKDKVIGFIQIDCIGIIVEFGHLKDIRISVLNHLQNLDGGLGQKNQNQSQ